MHRHLARARCNLFLAQVKGIRKGCLGQHWRQHSRCALRMHSTRSERSFWRVVDLQKEDGAEGRLACS